jgi:hypothetical protein
MQQMQQMQQATGVGVPATAAATAGAGEVAPGLGAGPAPLEQPGPNASELVEALAMERAKATNDAAAAAGAASSSNMDAPTMAGGGGAGEESDDLGPDTAPDLMSLGTNYGTCTQLLFSGKPMVMSGGGKWACVVSRRQFPSEEQLRSHIQMSDLYKDALKGAIASGKITLRVM